MAKQNMILVCERMLNDETGNRWFYRAYPCDSHGRILHSKLKPIGETFKIVGQTRTIFVCANDNLMTEDKAKKLAIAYHTGQTWTYSLDSGEWTRRKGK